MSVSPQELVRTLLQREKTALAGHAARRQQLRDSLPQLMQRASVRPARAWLIGSLAWGGFGERSDIDVVVEGLSETEASALWSELVAGLHESVDILRLETLPASFRAIVLKDGVALQ